MTLVWRKSSRSAGGSGNGNSGDCVEVAIDTRRAFLRDSKHADEVLRATPAAFAALVRSARAR